jgi:hypothetical protein
MPVDAANATIPPAEEPRIPLIGMSFEGGSLNALYAPTYAKPLAPPP